MKAKINFRSYVFQRAYRIRKEQDCTFSEALTQAWDRYREFKEDKAAKMVRLINSFDPYYMYSDDNRVYRKHTDMQDEIRDIRDLMPVSFIGFVKQRLADPAKISQFV